MTHDERSEVTDLLSALLLEAKKTTAVLKLMAEKAGVQSWVIDGALEDAEQMHEEDQK